MVELLGHPFFTDLIGPSGSDHHVSLFQNQQTNKKQRKNFLFIEKGKENEKLFKVRKMFATRKNGFNSDLKSILFFS